MVDIFIMQFSIIPMVCLFCRFCVSERGKLAYLQYDYDIDVVYQKEGNWIIPTICLFSRFYVSQRGNCVIPRVCLCPRHRVSERGKLYHTYSIFVC